MIEQQAILFCTFCGRPQTDVAVLITAPDGSAAICGDCVALAVDIAASHEKDRLAAQAKEETEWCEREATPDWQKGLHHFIDQTLMPGSRDPPV